MSMYKLKLVPQINNVQYLDSVVRARNHVVVQFYHGCVLWDFNNARIESKKQCISKKADRYN